MEHTQGRSDHHHGERPVIRKLGTFDCDIVETTPIQWQGRLWLLESIHPGYPGNASGVPYFRFRDVEDGMTTSPFAHGHGFGSAFVEDGIVRVFGVFPPGGPDVHVFCSRDLEHWDTSVALRTPAWGVYNVSVCQGPDAYYMAFEVGEPPEVAGVRFTNRFARSEDLAQWAITHESQVYSKERYTACPTIRYCAGWFYLVYLEHKTPAWEFEECIVRSRDLEHWEMSSLNPVLCASDEDRTPANSRLSPEQRERIRHATNINNSDIDFCEFRGRTVISYSWGNQTGTEHLALAEYDGSEQSFLESFFPEEPHPVR